MSHYHFKHILASSRIRTQIAIGMVLIAIVIIPFAALAQKPFIEGTVIYNMTTQTPDGSGGMIKNAGTFTYTIKGRELRKEIKMDNGYQNILIINSNMVYSLKSRGDKKYAIQLNMDNLLSKQQPYQGFKINEQPGATNKIAGYDCRNAQVIYKNDTANIYYTPEWYPTEPVTFEHFPGIKVWPLSYSYTLSNGAIIQFTAIKMDVAPVESALFHIPTGYKMITPQEYEQMKE